MKNITVNFLLGLNLGLLSNFVLLDVGAHSMVFSLCVVVTNVINISRSISEVAIYTDTPQQGHLHYW